MSKDHKQESLTEQIKEFARSVGFGPVGVTTADPAGEAEVRLQQWLQQGMAAGMDYMKRPEPRRSHPRDLLPEAESVLCLAFNYYPGEDAAKDSKKDSGRIAKYARGRDYHRVLKKKLKKIEQYLVDVGGAGTKVRSFVDSAPLLEREFARRAGLGFIGRNTHLITLGKGSWVFLAEVLSSLRLKPDEPVSFNCGACTACLEACPTGALPEPFVLDSRRCISYWTIEHKGEIVEEKQAPAGDWLFGCDICQEVCPFNHKPELTGEESFREGVITSSRIPLDEILEIESEEEYREKFQGSPLMRPKLAGMKRNAEIVRRND
jgi:epoxyqueuosine reductase